jgi:hypothetical protein
MSDGTHTLHVSSLDVNGNLIDITRQISYVNVPDTTFDGNDRPGEGGAANSTATSFTFPSLALCKLDDTDIACTNASVAAALNGKPDGAHTLSVAAGKQVASTAYYDKTPALRHWTIDTAAPVTAISSGPPAVTSDPFATFAFAAPSLTPVVYECSLDGGAFSACASGVRYDNLGTGGHTFAVRGTDAAGNHGDARTQSWTVVPATTTPGGSGGASGSGGSTGTGGSTGSGGAITGPSGTTTPVSSPPRRVGGNFTWRFRWKGSKTWFTRLRLTGVTHGAKVSVTCHGHGCPRGKHLTLRKLVGHKLRKGAVIEVRITKAGMTGAVVDLVVGKAGKDPTMRTKCLAAGARKPTAC